MSASLGLYRLQQVDRQIDRAHTQLETIRKTLENDRELKDALTLVETTDMKYRTAKQALHLAESEAESQKIKIQQVESSLYSGTVHNPKELQDLQKEVASLKKHLVTLEERQLEAMLKAEAEESATNEARSGLEKVQARLSGEHKKLFEDQASILKDLERLSEEREASVNPVEAKLLEIYNELRKQKRGIAVTEFEENSCSSCGSTLTSTLQQVAKSSKQLAYCPSCGRILYTS
ncbi:MAG: C4-type zinc ribbon domain-containing protein [Anaerolineales bacterium]